MPGQGPLQARLAAHYWSANFGFIDPTDGCEQLFGQQLIGNCHSARGEDGAFEDDGEATTAVNRKAPVKMIAEAYITASTAVIGGDAYQ